MEDINDYGNFGSKTFLNISKEKKEMILRVAIKEFADNGFSASNINVIAKKAEISIGSMYSYFASKEDLFLTVVHYGKKYLWKVIKEVDNVYGGFFDKIDKLISLAITYSKEYPLLIKLYNNITTGKELKIIQRLDIHLEEDYKNLYIKLLKEAIENKEIKKDIDIGMTAYLIDSIVVMVQLSFSNEYYKDKLVKYLNKEEFNNDNEFKNEVVKFIRRSLND